MLVYAQKSLFEDASKSDSQLFKELKDKDLTVWSPLLKDIQDYLKT